MSKYPFSFKSNSSVEQFENPVYGTSDYANSLRDVAYAIDELHEKRRDSALRLKAATGNLRGLTMAVDPAWDMDVVDPPIANRQISHIKVPQNILDNPDNMNEIKEALQNMGQNSVMIVPNDWTIEYDTIKETSINNKEMDIINTTQCGACGTMFDNWHQFCIQCGVKL